MILSIFLCLTEQRNIILRPLMETDVYKRHIIAYVNMLTGCMPCILSVDKLNNIGRIINMITVNAIGDTCPSPVVKTKKAIEALTQPDTVETLVAVSYTHLFSLRVSSLANFNSMYL